MVSNAYKSLFVYARLHKFIFKNSLQDSFPYCVVMEASQELDCSCDDWETDNDDYVIFPSEEFFVNIGSGLQGSKGGIKSIFLHSCQKLRLHLDLRSLPKNLNRLR
jgi:hypothetical protein